MLPATGSAHWEHQRADDEHYMRHQGLAVAALMEEQAPWPATSAHHPLIPLRGCVQAVFLLIGKTSALTMNIAGVIKDWLLIFFSYYLFGAPVTALNLLGYAFCCTGVRHNPMHPITYCLEHQSQH